MEIFQQNGLYGLKNDCGEVIISPQYREFYPFSCGLACVRDVKYQYAYIDINNIAIVPFGKYIWIDPQFIGGYARVKTSDNKYWGVIDTTGKIAVIPNLDYIRPLIVKPSPIKGWGNCIHVNGIYTGKVVGYIIDRISRSNLPVDFEFEEEVFLNAKEWDTLHPQNELGLLSHTTLVYNENYNSDYEEYRLDTFEGDESNYWNID